MHAKVELRRAGPNEAEIQGKNFGHRQGEIWNNIDWQKNKGTEWWTRDIGEQIKTKKKNWRSALKEQKKL